MPERILAKVLSIALDAPRRPGHCRCSMPPSPGTRPQAAFSPRAEQRDERVYADELVAPANDHALARLVWSVGEELTGVSYLNQTEPSPPG